MSVVDEPLEGGGRLGATRRDGVVVRPRKPWSDAVLALLLHLEEAGYPYAPRVGEGQSDSEEVVLYVEGDQAPQGWSDDGITELGSALRLLHEAAATFDPSPGLVWQEGWWTRDRGERSVLGHGDPAPWNVIAREGRPVAFVDWEFAGPVDRVAEVAHAAWLNCQLHDDDVAERQGLPPAPDRARQLGLFLDGYGLAADERERFVDELVEVALLSAANEATGAGVTPETTDATAIWGLAWRARSGAWMIRNRKLLAAAITR